MVCRLSSCCCCSLRMGTLILGYFGLISGIITFFDTIINLGYIYVNGGLEFSNEIPDGDHNAFATLATCVEIYYIIILVICIQGVLFNYLLLIGIYKEEPKLIKFCLITSKLFKIYGLLVLIILIMLSYAPDMIEELIGNLLKFALHIFFSSVFYSYYLQVIENVEKGKKSQKDDSNTPPNTSQHLTNENDVFVNVTL